MKGRTTMQDYRQALCIGKGWVDEINRFLTDPDNTLIELFLRIVEKHGGVEGMNKKAGEARKLENIFDRLKEAESPYLADLEWLIDQRDKGAFISIENYRDRVLGDSGNDIFIDDSKAVTLEISALQFFPWLVAEARQAIEKGELMPGRYIRVRNMKEQAADHGDILAVSAAMQVIGASYVETLDTKGTDGSNIHLGGPETITGYFGGVGQPNDYPFRWLDEYLYYYTNYGIRQVLNVNAGTILLACMLHKLGIDNEFKISVYMGIDNPFAILWTLMTARMFARDDGSTSLVGFNLSNSINNETMKQGAVIRKALGLEKAVRFEHHVIETCKSIVCQPYNRRDELVELAREIPNMAAKHEGGEPEVEKGLEHPSDILDYFMTKAEILEKGLMGAMERNYLEKHRSVNLTAGALTRAGVGLICAWNLHNRSSG